MLINWVTTGDVFNKVVLDTISYHYKKRKIEEVVLLQLLYPGICFENLKKENLIFFYLKMLLTLELVNQISKGPLLLFNIQQKNASLFFKYHLLWKLMFLTAFALSSPLKKSLSIYNFFCLSIYLSICKFNLFFRIQIL